MTVARAIRARPAPHSPHAGCVCALACLCLRRLAAHANSRWTLLPLRCPYRCLYTSAMCVWRLLPPGAPPYHHANPLTLLPRARADGGPRAEHKVRAEDGRIPSPLSPVAVPCGVATAR